MADLGPASMRNAYQVFLRRLEQLPPSQRLHFLRGQSMAPLHAAGRYTNPENLRTAIAAGSRRGWVEFGYVLRRLRWDGQIVRAVLYWGERHGYLERLGRRRYRIVRVPDLDAQPSMPRPMAG